MDLGSAKRLLSILIENSVRILAADFGVDRAEPNFFQIVDLVREHPALKEVLLSHIAATLKEPHDAILRSDLPPRELIELLVHEFRWPEFDSMRERRLAELFSGDARLAAGDMYHHIADAQRDDWPDRDLYARYRSKDGGR
jgi:hypothetical protein